MIHADLSVVGDDAAGAVPDPYLAYQLGVLEILFDQMPMGISVTDRNFVLQRFNPTLVNFITRYSTVTAAAVLPGTPFFELLPETEPVLRPLLLRVLDGETVRQAALPLVANDVVSYWDVVFTPIRDGTSVTGVLSVVIDANARTQAQQRLAEREAEYRSIFEATGEGIVICRDDVQRPAADGGLGLRPGSELGRVGRQPRSVGHGLQHPGPLGASETRRWPAQPWGCPGLGAGPTGER